MKIIKGVMGNNKIRKRIDKLIKIRQEAEVEIKKIQKDCNHSVTYIGVFSWRVGNYKEYHICKHCNFPVKPTGDNPFWEFGKLGKPAIP